MHSASKSSLRVYLELYALFYHKQALPASICERGWCECGIMRGMKHVQPAHKVLVMLSNASVTHRDHLRGILEYVRENIFPPWDVQLGLSDIDEGYPQSLSRQGYDGIIAAVHRADDRRKVFASGIPAVLFEPTLFSPARRTRPANTVTFFNDHEAEGRTAADYFLERGYRSFAYVGTASRTAWSEARRKGFASRLSKSGFVPIVYAPPPPIERKDFAREAKRLVAWLKGLAPRTAVFVAHDERAREVVLAAKRARRTIPGDLAILGVDDDELLCSTASPPLSSIAVDARETGARFAYALDALLKGRFHEPIVRTCHTQVVTRRSTDAFSLDDPFLSRALSYAAANLATRPRLDELAAAAHCSKRTLQLRARAILGHSLKDEITALQLREACRRLATRHAAPEEIARETGFCNASHLYRRMRECPPSVR